MSNDEYLEPLRRFRADVLNSSAPEIHVDLADEIRARLVDGAPAFFQSMANETGKSLWDGGDLYSPNRISPRSRDWHYSSGPPPADALDPTPTDKPEGKLYP